MSTSAKSAETEDDFRILFFSSLFEQHLSSIYYSFKTQNQSIVAKISNKTLEFSNFIIKYSTQSSPIIGLGNFLFVTRVFYFEKKKNIKKQNKITKHSEV